MKNEKILRAFALDLKTDEHGTVEGYATVFNQRTNIAGMFDEQIDSKAFDGADLTDVVLLVNHDISRLALARSRRNTSNSTLQLSVDSKGLKIKAVLDVDNNTEAKNLYSAISRGDIDGMSFMFSVSDEKWENLREEVPLRTITKINKVYEVSAVNFPAYKGTEIYAKSSEPLANEKTALENARSVIKSQDAELALAKEKALFKIKSRQAGGK